MVLKSPRFGDHPTHLLAFFDRVHLHNMGLNPDKYFFGVGGGKFLVS